MSHIQDPAQYFEAQLSSQKRSFHTRGIGLDTLITMCEENPKTWAIVDQVRLDDERSMHKSIKIQATLVHNEPLNSYVIHREVVRVDKNGDETPMKLINCLKAKPRHGHAPFNSVVGMFERVCFEMDGRFIWLNDRKLTEKIRGKVQSHWPLHWNELEEK